MIELINCVHTKSFVGLIASLILITTLISCVSTISNSNGQEAGKSNKMAITIPKNHYSINNDTNLSSGSNTTNVTTNTGTTSNVTTTTGTTTTGTTTTTVNPLEGSDSSAKNKETRSKKDDQQSETFIRTSEGQRSYIMESLLSELPNFRIQITPKVERFNDSAYNVLLLATVLRKSNDILPLELPPVKLQDELVKDFLLRYIFQAYGRKVDGRGVESTKPTETTTSKPLNTVKAEESANPGDGKHVKSPDNIAKNAPPVVRETDQSSINDNATKVISNAELEKQTAEVIKDALESMSNIAGLDSTNQTPISVLETGTTIKPSTLNSENTVIVNRTLNNQVTKSSDNVDLKLMKNTLTTPATNQVHGSSIPNNQSANQTQTTVNPISSSSTASTETIPNRPLKKAPEAKWKPEGIKSGPEYYIIPGSPINRFNYNENEIYDERTRSNQIAEPPIKPITPTVPQNVRSTLQLDQGQGYTSTPAPQQIPLVNPIVSNPINIKLHNLPPPPPSDKTNPNNQIVNVIGTRNTNEQYPIRNPVKPFFYDQYNGHNQGENSYKPRSKYPSGQPIAIEEIVHSQGSKLDQRNQLQIQPEMFVKIIRHYFANALTPEESRVTFVRKAPIVPPQSRPLASQ